MDQENFQLYAGDSIFNCIRRGYGPRLLICLHGFGETTASFECLEPLSTDGYTIVAIDLPFHGATRWKGDRFTPGTLLEIIRDILSRFPHDGFSLLGYSMGGRLCLCLTEKLLEVPEPESSSLKHLILLAPDGLKNNPWYLLATGTRAGERLFHYSAVHPQFFMRLLKCWRRLRLMNRSIYKFTAGRMDTVEKRMRVYEVWTTLSPMKPGIKKLKKLIGQHNLPVLLLFGKYDRVIPPSLGMDFCRGLPSCKSLVMEKGHGLLTSETVWTIKKQLDNTL